MTLPRPVIADRTYLLTRRVRDRQFLLRPTPTIKRVNGYVLAVAQGLFEMGIHAYATMSNHHHELITPSMPNAPEFYAFVHANMARALNVHYERKENFWEAPAQTHMEPKLTREAILASGAYVVGNPVLAELVPYAQLWEGLISHGQGYEADREVVFKRPGFYFNPDNSNWPEEAVLRLTKPPGFEDMSEEGFYDLVCEKVVALEDFKHKEMRGKGKTFMGMRVVLRTSHKTTAETEPKPKARRRRPPSELLNPQVQLPAWVRSAQDIWNEWLKDWREVYRKARKKMLKRAKAVFPVGTYWLRRFVGVTVGEEPRPPPDFLGIDDC